MLRAGADASAVDESGLRVVECCAVAEDGAEERFAVVVPHRQVVVRGQTINDGDQGFRRIIAFGVAADRQDAADERSGFSIGDEG